MAQFHCLEYENDIFKSRFSFFPLILICLAYIFTLIVNLGNIITEKQSKMKVNDLKFYDFKIKDGHFLFL
jgi:hypothetical protein